MNSTARDLRREARHISSGPTPDEYEARLAALRRHGLDEAGADKVFELIPLPPVEVIDQRIENLRALGFD
ncbi:MAG TPA: hypothetical protein DHW63_07880, partial [Hyphomonadaceae bacterium]|nr:hypothetical protein [Hyphomonadaceae bacterium]